MKQTTELYSSVLLLIYVICSHFQNFQFSNILLIYHSAGQYDQKIISQYIIGFTVYEGFFSHAHPHFLMIWRQIAAV